MNRNLTLLAASQALWLCGAGAFATLNAIVGEALAPGAGLATAPNAVLGLTTALAAAPASHVMGRYGRRAGFMGAALVGAVGGLGAAAAVVAGSFLLFCLASACLGIMQAFALYYRFAAVEAAPDRPATAISTTLAGGVAAAFIGPALAPFGAELLPPFTFAGSFLLIAGLALASACAAAGFSGPLRGAAQSSEAQVTLSWAELFARPSFVIGVLHASAAYSAMVFVMATTPLAMIACGLTLNDAALVIQWHIFAMFAPSFFTGRLIERLGVWPVLNVGFGLLVGAAVFATSGLELWRFTAALIVIGVGWNFAYVAASTLISESHAPEERASAQAGSEVLIFGSVAVATAGSGAAFQFGGWSAVALIPIAFLAIAGLASWRQARRGARVAAADLA